VRPRVAAVAAAVLAVVAAAPSYAVQTERFSLTTGDSRTALIHAPGDGVLRDAVVVANRTGRPITLRLDVVAATLNPDGNFALGQSGAGLAADIRLAVATVSLPPRASRDVAVVIDRPMSIDDDEYAAVTAVEVSPDDPGGFAVTERLALLVGITADAPPEAGTGGGGDDTDPLRWVLVAVAGALVVGGAVAWARRRTSRAA
jgi:hypothetical protein